MKVALICLILIFLVSCGGGGTCTTCTPTPTPIPTPTPAPMSTPTVLWKVALPPSQPANAGGANILSLVVSGINVLGGGVKANGAVDTNAYTASVTDNSGSAVASTPVSLSEVSGIGGMLLLDPATAFAVGADQPPSSSSAVPTAFTLNPATGAFLSIKPFSCPAGSALDLTNATGATAVARDGTNPTMYVALGVHGDVPRIVKTDLAGNVDCATAAVRVVDADPNGIVAQIVVTADSYWVAGSFSAIAQGFVVRIDRTSRERVWESIIAGTLVAGITFDSTGNLYVGGSSIGNQDAWIIQKFQPPFTGVNQNVAWATHGIPPSQPETADVVVAILLSQNGDVIAVGQTTPAGQTNVNHVQTSVAVLDPGTGATKKTIQVDLFGQLSDHVGSAALSPNNTLYVAGDTASTNAWFAKLGLE